MATCSRQVAVALTKLPAKQVAVALAKLPAKQVAVGLASQIVKVGWPLLLRGNSSRTLLLPYRKAKPVASGVNVGSGPAQAP